MICIIIQVAHNIVVDKHRQALDKLDKLCLSFWKFSKWHRLQPSCNPELDKWQRMDGWMENSSTLS